MMAIMATAPSCEAAIPGETQRERFVIPFHAAWEPAWALPCLSGLADFLNVERRELPASKVTIMRSRRLAARRATPSIPMTPLIDIVFLLLIYFMLASSFVERGEMEVQLPRAALSQDRTERPVSIRMAWRLMIT